MNKKHKEQLIGNGLDILTGTTHALVTAVKALPFVLVIYLLVIYPNC